MEDFRLIEFQRLRDFSMKVNATFEFVKQNFKSLAKSILVIAGPPALLGSFVMGNFLEEFMNFSQMLGRAGGATQATNYFASADFWLQILLLMVLGLFSFVFTLATINNYIILYGEKKTNQIEIPEVWARVRETFWMYFLNSIFFGILALIAYVVLVVPVVLLATISPWLIFFGILFLIAALFYLVFSTSLTFFICGYEKKGFFDSIARSFYLVRDKWWSTFGLISVLYIIVMVISYVFMVPYYIVIFSTSLHQSSPDSFAAPSDTLLLVTKIFFTLYYLAQILLYTLPNVGIAFQYFNLVELKEAKGLMKDIENFGQAADPAANRPEEHY